MILVIDNYDSFTYNLVDIIAVSGLPYKVIYSDPDKLDNIISIQPEKIVISPGPSSPEKALLSLKALDYAYHNSIPLLGVCLGHQVIGHYFNSKVVKLPKPYHGKISNISVNPIGIFKNIPYHIKVTRYHSLTIENITNSQEIIPTAYSQDDNAIMAVMHKTKPIYGVQFHPESITTEYGSEIVCNFLRL